MEEWHRERRSASLIRRFEEFVRRHVVRSELPYAGAANSDPSTNGESLHNGEPDEGIYSAHIDGGSRHRQFERSPGSPIYEAGGQVKKKDSLFDYGSKN